MTSDEIAARKAAIRSYFAAQVSALPTVATTTTSRGTVVDWVRPEDVWPTPSDKPPALVMAVPDKPGGSGPSVDGVTDKPATNELVLEPGARGPVGTVPVVRFNVEYYLATTAIPPARPQDIFVKKLPTFPEPKPNAEQRYYASWKHAGSYRGSDGYINIWDGEGPSKSDTNIGQVALFNKDSGQIETVEAGKIEQLSLNGGSSAPFFFVFFTNNAYSSNDHWVGGYNTTVKGWHQVSSTWAPGIGISGVSAADGDQASIHLEVRQNGVGDWWVAVEGEWVGYYPRCVDERADCSQGSLYAGTGLGGGATFAS